MRLNTIRIPCKNLIESEDFYSNKLKLKKVFGSLQERYIGFEIENAQIIIEPEEKGEFESNRYLGFSVDVKYIDLFYKEMLKNGVKFTGAPKKQAWGGKMTHIIDPSQNSFSVIQEA